MDIAGERLKICVLCSGYMVLFRREKNLFCHAYSDMKLLFLKSPSKERLIYIILVM